MTIEDDRKKKLSQKERSFFKQCKKDLKRSKKNKLKVIKHGKIKNSDNKRILESSTKKIDIKIKSKYNTFEYFKNHLIGLPNIGEYLEYIKIIEDRVNKVKLDDKKINNFNLEFDLLSYLLEVNIIPEELDREIFDKLIEFQKNKNIKYDFFKRKIAIKKYKNKKNNRLGTNLRRYKNKQIMAENRLRINGKFVKNDKKDLKKEFLEFYLENKLKIGGKK